MARDPRTWRPQYRTHHVSKTRRDEMMLRYTCERCGAAPGYWCAPVPVGTAGDVAVYLHDNRRQQASQDWLLPLVEDLESAGIDVDPKLRAAQQGELPPVVTYECNELEKKEAKVKVGRQRSVTMSLCQAYSSHWSPKPDVLYLFKADPKCNLCTAIVKEIEEADNASGREQADT